MMRLFSGYPASKSKSKRATSRWSITEFSMGRNDQQHSKDWTRFPNASYPIGARGLLRQLAPGLQIANESSPQAYKAISDTHTDANFFLVWPPNLFSFTSVFLHTTGAYTQLAHNHRGNSWPPDVELIWRIVEDGLRAHDSRSSHSAQSTGNSQHLRQIYGTQVEEYRRAGRAETNATQGIPPRGTWAEFVGTVARSWVEQLKQVDPTDLCRVLLPLTPRGNFVKNPRRSHRAVYRDLAKFVDRLRVDLQLEAGFAEKLTEDALHQASRTDPRTPETLSSETPSYPDKLKEAVTAWTPNIIRPIWKHIELKMDPPRRATIDAIWSKGNWKTFCAIITLHAIADATCLGWGVRTFEKRQPQHCHRLATTLLRRSGNMALISNHRGRVLPKRHTPQVGVSLRSVSSSLAYHRSSVRIGWSQTRKQLVRPVERAPTNSPKQRSDGDDAAGRGQLSLLLLPWPLKVDTLDFAATRYESAFRVSQPYPTRTTRSGYFAYRPRQESSADEMIRNGDLREVIRSARQHTEKIDLLVLPECALADSTLDAFELVCREESVGAYIAGVRSHPTDHATRATNTVCFGIREDSARSGRTRTTFTRLRHHKHHPWCLDRNQIEAYHLGGALHPSVPHWEDIAIGPKRATLVTFGGYVTVMPIICEDLARQDALSDLVRAVGPNLVVTILMDGPQLRSRWAAKYASVFGEDPGCAVLTLTSMGMIDRWATGRDRGFSTVGLWTQRQESPREIKLGEDSRAVLLSVAVDAESDVTIDGRVEDWGTATLRLGGIHDIP